MFNGNLVPDGINMDFSRERNERQLGPDEKNSKALSDYGVLGREV